MPLFTSFITSELPVLTRNPSFITRNKCILCIFTLAMTEELNVLPTLEEKNSNEINKPLISLIIRTVHCLNWQSLISKCPKEQSTYCVNCSDISLCNNYHLYYWHGQGGWGRHGRVSGGFGSVHNSSTTTSWVAKRWHDTVRVTAPSLPQVVLHCSIKEQIEQT